MRKAHIDTRSSNKAHCNDVAHRGTRERSSIRFLLTRLYKNHDSMRK